MKKEEIGPNRLRCISMTGKEVAELAWKGGEMPDWMAAPEQLLFQTVKQIAWNYRQGLPVEQATREKNLAIREFERNAATHEYYLKTCELWLRISLPAMEYTLNPSLKAAEEFFRAVYRFPADFRKDEEAFTRALEQEAAELRELLGEAAG